ncbi:MAG TPA: sel1 repeat family protein [Sulfurovum sp.]|nr:sel1 repeat family protein [Sulfurovum sp.]
MKMNTMKILLLMGLGTSLNAEMSTPQVAKDTCDNGNARGCFNLAFMYDFGEGVNQDTLKAIELYTKACDTGYAGGCLVLGAIYHAGEDVKKDTLRAKRLYSKACDGGNDRGCKEYSILKVNEKIVSK